MTWGERGVYVRLMDLRAQRIGAWSGIASVVLFSVAIIGLLQFLPPLAPSRSAASIAEHFDEHRTGIRFGAVAWLMAAVLWVPWSATIASHLRRSERDFPILAWTQVATAAIGAAVVIVAALCWVVAAFRPTRSADEIRLLSDLGFVLAIMPFFIFVVWNCALALAILGDRRATPAYPRWSAYLSLWLAFLYLPGGCLAFFQTGPFAWNGALAFFLPAVAFFVWMLVMTVLAFQAMAREAGRPAAASTPDSARADLVAPDLAAASSLG